MKHRGRSGKEKKNITPRNRNRRKFLQRSKLER
jgi:ribosomal protein S30